MFDDDYEHEEEYEIRGDFIDNGGEEDALWDDKDTADTEADGCNESDSYEIEIEQNEQMLRQVALEQNIIDQLEADAEEYPFEEDTGDEEPERKKLKREIQAEALARLEDSARTRRDFENIIAWWDRLDANRERRERYHELSRSGDDIPIDYGASANGLYFPDYLNDVLEKQMRSGDFIDTIFNCPYDIHELVTEDYLCKILWELNDEHKELLFLCAVRLFSATKIAAIRGQSDRNIRKVRATMLKKIRKKLLAALIDKHGEQQSLSLLEKEFLADNSEPVETAKKK